MAAARRYGLDPHGRVGHAILISHRCGRALYKDSSDPTVQCVVTLAGIAAEADLFGFASNGSGDRVKAGVLLGLDLPDTSTALTTPSGIQAMVLVRSARPWILAVAVAVYVTLTLACIVQPRRRWILVHTRGHRRSGDATHQRLWRKLANDARKA